MSDTGPAEPVASAAFDEAFTAAMVDSGCTLAILRDRLRDRGLSISLSTLSRWRSGERRPDGIRSLPVLTAIEQELGMHPGVLTSNLIGRSRRLGRISPETELEPRPTVIEMLRSLPVSPHADMRVLSLHDDVQIAPSGRIMAVTSILTVQGVNDEFSSIGLAVDVNELADAPPDVTILAGGVITESRRDSSRTALGLAVRLDTALEAGQTGMLSWTARYPSEHPAPDRYTCHATRPLRELLVLLHFDPLSLPHWIDEVVQTPEGSRTRTHTANSSSFHTLRSGFGPGRLQLSWGWD